MAYIKKADRDAKISKEDKDAKDMLNAGMTNNYTEPDPRYATKEDLNRINSSLERLTDILTTKPPETSEPVSLPSNIVAEKPDQSPVPPKWRAIVDEVLGTDFGINVVYPDQGSGFLFKIIVPKEKSNAAKDYLEMYKVDIRTKAISYQDGIEGVKQFCERVKKNLQKNTNKII